MPVVFLTKAQLAILTAIQSDMVIGSMQTCITITHANPDTNQAGASIVAKRACIKAHPANTGIVWVEFGAAAVDLECYPLNANESFSGPIANTDEINCLFKVGGEKVTVSFSN